MKDLQKYINQYMNFYTSDCQEFSDKRACNNPNGCYCKAISEVCAYIKYIIPEEYIYLSIYDFKGVSSMNEAIQNDPTVSLDFDILAQKAKEKIWEYCWRGKCPNDSDSRFSTQKMDSLSSIDKRFNDGSNLIIHGDSYYSFYDSNIRKNKKIKLQTGKSMLAAIVLKEAIRRKLFASNNASTYQYVSFPVLRNDLLDKDKKDYISDLSEVDWLVIDDIFFDGEYSHDYKQYFKRQFDAFLMSRVENGKPTIFVMQFNINDIDIKEDFGFAMDKVINLKSSFVVQV